jgi:shikimate dehydrogenase
VLTEPVGHRAGVLGSPIAHSLSPVLHRAAYRALGLDDWSYHATEMRAAGLAHHVACLDPSWRGLSLTMPLKEVAFEVATSVSDVARESGSINTLVRTGGGWQADNTDVHGIVHALAEAGVGAVGSAVLIGSGATARSAVMALTRLGGERVTFMVRGAARAATVAQARAAGLRVEEVPPGEWPRGADLVVSTVPPEATAALGPSLPEEGRVLLDVVYGGGVTALMAAARDKGYAVVPGTQMLLHQAGEQVRLMTGRPAPLAAMREALTAALAGRDTG